MALILKMLGWGSLAVTGNPPAETALLPNYAAVTGKGLIVKNIILTNEGPNPIQLYAYLRRGDGTTEYLISPQPMQIPANEQVILNSELTLDLGLNGTSRELVYAKCLTPNLPVGQAVRFAINGFERDI